MTFLYKLNEFQTFQFSTPALVQAGSLYTYRFSIPAINVGWVYLNRPGMGLSLPDLRHSGGHRSPMMEAP